MNWTKEDVRNALKELIAEPGCCGTYCFRFGVDDLNRIWALVMAWQDGYENTPGGFPCQYKTERIVMKVGWKPINAPMSDYDIDWLQPYDTETGDVDDREISLSTEEDFDNAYDWMIKSFEDFKANYFDKEMEY